MHSLDLSKWLIVIPARLNSERLPNKPLADLNGKPLIARVFENLLPLQTAGARLTVALDHETTASACEKLKIPYTMTKECHQSGTDRCAEVAQKLSKYPFVLNVQGDEPFVNLNDLQNLMKELEKTTCKMATLGFRRSDRSGYENPNVVKIALGSDSTAIYFSRAPIPFDREAMRTGTGGIVYTQHLGVYAYRREALGDFCALPPSDLERSEKLEQLRAVSAGWKIQVTVATTTSIGIDTPEDLEIARRIFNG